MYDDIVKALTGLSQVFITRPKALAKDLTSFLIVELPARIYPSFKGGRDTKATSTGKISVFYKAKADGTPNIGAQTDLTQKVLDRFPINGDHITATNPVELMTGEDGTGYHVTILAFRLRTKLNARDIV